jgi:UPF0271 protein
MMTDATLKSTEFTSMSRLTPDIDLNADVGEGGVHDAALFDAGLSSVNVACGAHAGDEASMAAVCARAAARGVALGAHPGWADRASFGRAEREMGGAELARLIGWQLGALGRQAAEAGLTIRHVKPHGALYHYLNREPERARVFVGAVGELAPGAAVFGPPEGALREATEAAGLEFIAEGFIDRAYRGDGSLVPRGEPGAVLHSVTEAAAQAVALARAGRVRTLCVHGDGAEAPALLGAARAALAAAGFRILAPGSGA